ncbi:hypothetical protein PIB30_014019 [Stylosanthes scabra]|uniref:Gnk2-homologous domain-containing protein n=1 Tax=Stylosanthes scabra TaxID=79078 RepID=A0ABU6Y523_9FABA|nr:hypothetical protein [Stylosanthes scabra]
MSSSITILLCVSVAGLVVQTCYGTTAEATGPLFHFCSNSGGNFTAHSAFESNLKTLINSLIYKTPPTGFAVSTIGQPQSQQAYGLALCRGDASPQDCKTCLSEATKELRSRCQYNTGAIIWYDYCEFKYLDTDFFGQVDNTNKFYMWNLNNVTDTAAFNHKTKELLSQLALEASTNPKLYAAGEMKLGVGESNDNKMLYGLTQCTRDVSSVDCKKCLDEAISELPNCCDGKQGGRVVGGSCNFRYEIYPFLNN